MWKSFKNIGLQTSEKVSWEKKETCAKHKIDRSQNGRSNKKFIKHFGVSSSRPVELRSRRSDKDTKRNTLNWMDCEVLASRNKISGMQSNWLRRPPFNSLCCSTHIGLCSAHPAVDYVSVCTWRSAVIAHCRACINKSKFLRSPAVRSRKAIF